MIGVATLELQALLDRNRDKVMMDTSNEPAKRSPRIKLLRFYFTEKGSDLDISISPGVTSYFEFFLRLPQQSQDLVSDEIQLLTSPDQVLHFPGSSRKSPNNDAPHNTEIQTINFDKENDSSKEGNICQPNNNVSEHTTTSSASTAFAFLRMNKLFKNTSTAKI